MRGTLPNRIVVRLLVVAWAPALLVSAALSMPMIELRREQMLEQATERLIQASRTTEAIYQERMAFANLLADLLAERAAFVQAARPEDPAALAEFVRSTREHTMFDLVTLVDAERRVLAQDGAVPLWRGVPGTRIAIWGAPGAGVVVEVHATVPGVASPAQTFVGSFAIDDQALVTFRDRTGLEQRLLVDSQLVASSLPVAGDNSVLSDGVPFDLARLEEARIGEVQIGQDSYIARYKSLRDTTGQVVAVTEHLLPLTPVRSAQAQATTLLLTITLLAVLAAAILAATLTRWFARPIHQLGRASAALGRGALAQPVRIRGPHELMALGEVMETARQQLAATQAALCEEKERYAAILESISDALLTIDAHGSITGLNSAAAQILGCPQDTAVGRRLADLLPTVDGQPLQPEQVPLGSSARLALRHKDGQPRTVVLSRCLLLGRPDSTREYVLLLRDISDEVVVAQLKEAFLANITHEFQTPLASQLASLEMLREEEAALTPAERTDLLETVYTGTRRLQYLVGNLLDGASLQAGYFRVEPDLSDLRPLVAEAIATIEPMARQRRQTIAVELPPQLPAIYADEQRLIQAMVNLLSNASKFSPPDAPIRLQVWVIDGNVQIAVTDHGPGVAPARQNYLFERFLRPGTETVRAQGAGLGLAITRAIVESHGGTVVLLQSTVGETTFAITLPQAFVPEEELDETITG